MAREELSRDSEANQYDSALPIAPSPSSGEIAMKSPTQLLQSLLNDDCGADLIEYAMIASVLALASIASFRTLTNRIGSEFNRITNSF
jgi:Flp pilus assembly pilin Flp